MLLEEEVWDVVVYWSCQCGRWTASEAFATWAHTLDVCQVIDGCGSPLSRRVEVHTRRK